MSADRSEFPEPGGPRRVIILGAAGRDFHVFNTCFRENPRYRVVAFTAAQIPGIENRVYPPSLSGPLYPDGIPIHPEARLEQLIAALAADEVVLAYSDLSHVAVMHLASRALACGADFRFIGPARSFLKSSRPVISVCAVRTGCGKNAVVRRIAAILKSRGLRPVVVRHPMPYGDLERQAVQRFASLADCDRQQCTIEEREEYEQHIAEGTVVFAGVDYARILAAAQAEADFLLWDGGNNDWSFFRPDLEIVLVDPHRPGHELLYHPGETNLRRAHVVVINKIDSAPPGGVQQVMANIAQVNPTALVVQARSAITVDRPELLRGRRVLVIEDGPTLTHGEMAYGSGTIAAHRYGAAEIVDPRPAARGSLAETYLRYPWVERALPAMGYFPAQLSDLAATIAAVDCDVILVATPIDLSRLIALPRPHCRAVYRLEEIGRPDLEEVVAGFIEGRVPAKKPATAEP
ncbi:MAG TPA: cyclic 2,3-diphosphoglycerate synthase [candidate division Zixibacteria bacterium]|nr:cyclic 2,3-diphosphoglycerate synthase [candidate division Zixibacteria bacterium]